MARKTEAPPKARFWWFGYAIRISIGALILVGGLFAYHRTERFLVRDQRFLMQQPDYGMESPSLSINGVHYASRMQILRVFSNDFGRSVNLVPLSDRREQIRALDWIRDASVSRVWPDRIVVHVEEREPVGFLQVPSAEKRVNKMALIDGDGVILQQPYKAQFKLPVILGVPPNDPPVVRRDRVRRVLRLMKDIGDLGNRVSEVDISDRENLKVTARANDRAMVLMLGDRNYAQRLQNFIQHFPEVQQRLPNATMLDMRIEDRITVVGERK